MTNYKKSLSSIYYFFNIHRWYLAIKDPGFALREIVAILKHPVLFIIISKVEGKISNWEGVLLYRTVLKSKHSSKNIVEVGAFKGLSTVYLARAAQTIGKRVKSFELFSGLPTSDLLLDPNFQTGKFSSEVSEYDNNLRACGVRDIVDLVIGDARQTMLPSLALTGFSVAFLDVDVYEVMRELLPQLWSIAQGNELILVHDIWSPGVRKAIDEFHALSGNAIKEVDLIKGPKGTIAILTLPPKIEPTRLRNYSQNILYP
jgi:predicted O-methyltransferase YrrM